MTIVADSEGTGHDKTRGTGRASPLADRMAAKFLTFTLGTEEYGIDIRTVCEIGRYNAVTHIADAPPFIKGVINLRGTIVPVMDLRIKFGLSRS